MIRTKAKNFAFSITLIGALALATTTFADSNANRDVSARQINAANELLRDGKLGQAIEAYGNVASSEANRDELNYNMAVAQYRKADIQAATSLFGETAGSANASIAANSRFNLGNCLYATALQTAEQDKPAAIEQLRTAISHFRGSLGSMPDNDDARANIELAAELIRKLEDEQKQEEQQQQDQQQQQQQDQQQQDQQQNQDQQNQDQNSQDSQSQDSESQESESQDSQSKDSESNQSNDDQQPDDESKSESDKSKSEEANSAESEQDDSTGEPNESERPQPQDASEQEQSKQQSPSQSNSKQNETRQNQRNDAQQTNEDETSLDDERPQDNQPVPTGELTAADEQDDNKEPNGAVAMADPNAKDGPMTKEEALKMLQAVRDRDMLRRLRQQQRERSRHIPVDRNW